MGLKEKWQGEMEAWQTPFEGSSLQGVDLRVVPEMGP